MTGRASVVRSRPSGQAGLGDHHQLDPSWPQRSRHRSHAERREILNATRWFLGRTHERLISCREETPHLADRPPSPARSSQMAGSRAERAQTRRALSKLDTPVKMVLLATTQIHSQGLPGRRVSGRSSAMEHPGSGQVGELRYRRDSALLRVRASVTGARAPQDLARRVIFVRRRLAHGGASPDESAHDTIFAFFVRYLPVERLCFRCRVVGTASQRVSLLRSCLSRVRDL